jgi:hypothetical protein
MGARLLWSGYAKIIRLMIDKPVSWVEACGALNIKRRESAHKILYGLKDAGLAHIIDWDMENNDARRRRPVFAWGPGQDVPWPAGGRQRNRRVAPTELLALIVAIRDLMEEAHHGKSLAATTGVAPTTARNMLRALHQERLVYKDHYLDRGQNGAGPPLFLWGPNQPDAQKPRRQPMRALVAKHNHYRAVRNATANLLHAIAGSSVKRTRQLAHSAELVSLAL